MGQALSMQDTSGQGPGEARLRGRSGVSPGGLSQEPAGGRGRPGAERGPLSGPLPTHGARATASTRGAAWGSGRPGPEKHEERARLLRCHSALRPQSHVRPVLLRPPLPVSRGDRPDASSPVPGGSGVYYHRSFPLSRAPAESRPRRGKTPRGGCARGISGFAGHRKCSDLRATW